MGKRRADEFDSVFIEKGDEIPNDIPSLCLQQKTPLADAELSHALIQPSAIML